MKTGKRPAIPQLVKIADTVFSRYIRQLGATTLLQDEEGMSLDAGPCITCRSIKPIKYMDCGHFITRGCKLTRFDERNAHLQCKYCNGPRMGEQFKHGEAIKRLYGEDVLNELLDLERQYKRDGYKWTREELESIITTYRKKLLDLKSKGGLQRALDYP